MRIAIDIRLLARGGQTGIPGYTRELISGLIKITEKTGDTLLLFYNGFTRAPLPEAWRNASHVQIIERGVPNRLLDLVFHLPFVSTVAAQLLPHNADVIISPHFNLLPSSKTPRIITFHDLSFIHYPNFFSIQQRLWHTLQQYAKQATRAAGLITVSAYTKQDLVSLLHIPAEKISVVRSGISSVFKPLRTEDAGLQKYLADQGLRNPYVLYLGTLEYRKNIPALIRGFSEACHDSSYAHHELILAGKPGFGYEEIEAEVKKSSVRSRIRFLGKISDEERPYLYSGASAFVFPSFFEGFGFPPLEAQASGVPVISSLRSSLNEILGDSVLPIDPWRPHTIKEALIALSTSHELNTRLIQSGLRNAARFTWEKTAEQTYAAIQSIVHPQ